MLSQNLNLLCNLQDIENKENPVLTSPELVKCIIASLEANVNRCNSKFLDEKDKLDVILSSCNSKCLDEYGLFY